MTSNLFIVYRITNIVERKHYYGYKSCGNRVPKEIIGKTYFSSSSDKEFIAEQKNHPERFRYKIVARFNTREEALERETILHRKFHVNRNPNFYNRSIQSTSWSANGMMCAKDISGKVEFIATNDPRLETGELKSINKGKIVVSDNNGGFIQVSVDDYRFKTGELKPMFCGTVVVVGEENRKFRVSVDDPRFVSGELRAISRGSSVVRNRLTGQLSRIGVDDPALDSGLYIQFHKGTVNVISPEGARSKVPFDDPRIQSGDLEVENKNKIFVRSRTNKIFMTEKDDPRLTTGELTHASQGHANVRLGDRIVRVSTDDPRFKNGELTSIYKDTAIVIDPTTNKRMRVSIHDELYKTGFYVPINLGSKWMHKDGKRKRIPKYDIQKYIDDGWILGKLNVKHPNETASM
jgi:hypothetical protein